MLKFSQKLSTLGLQLPMPAAPVANYVSSRLAENSLIISGQICFGLDGTLADRHKGKLGGKVSIEDGIEAARLCALNLLAQVAAAAGDLDKVSVRCFRLGGFINADPSFTQIATVMNGASDLIVDLLGDEGRHARSTVGVAVLPMDAAVEIEGTFEILP